MIDDFVSSIAAATGQGEVHVRFLLGVLMTYPLCAIFYLLPYKPNIRHIFSVVTGLLLAQFVHGWR
jgi:hypothetical protein